MVPNNPLQVDEDSIQTETFNRRIGRVKFCAVKAHGEIFIPEHEGLKVIGISPNWLEDLSRTRKMRCRPWQVWPILWEYFCNRGNIKAASLLRHLAPSGLEHSTAA
jgi:hypothetical protein